MSEMERRILAAYNADKARDLQAIADELKCTRAYVCIIYRRHGLMRPPRKYRVRENTKKGVQTLFQWGKQLAPAVSGTVGELIVATDLMKRGYHVFRAMAWTCPCDLIAMDVESNRLLRVECKAGRVTRVSKKLKFVKPEQGRYDVLAVIAQDHSVYYFHGDDIELLDHGMSWAGGYTGLVAGDSTNTQARTIAPN